MWLANYVEGLAPGADGRVHPTWNAHGTPVGRFSVSKPNVGAIPNTKHDPDSMRSIVRAAPGNVLVYADMAQLHLRLIAKW
jgi:DNA polymerase I-like protein with 3'-5' exonuclease and polymerase domains